MKLSVSILSMKDDENIKCNIAKLDNCKIDYFHLDIMDGHFVSNKTWDLSEIKKILPITKKKYDVHLMVNNIEEYINDFSLLNPDYITFHFEATDNPIAIINLIKSKNIKVGISIKPTTDVKCLLPYLELIDLILIMSVEPGMGGQKFLESSISKIEYLYNLRQNENYNYAIEVDGGVNADTIHYCQKCDIVVVGSYITNNDYEESIKNLKLN